MRTRNATMKGKKKILNEYVLPMLTYSSETWTLNKAMEEMMAVSHRKMESIINQSINQSNFYGANIPGEARLSGATAESVFNSKIEETVP